ncbi:hypothetical protein HX037_01485 [Ignatzschineria indica]|uniref:hypothetical protein n=1 Tax=Ignatzschineria indica TaxID=472583 RepID=UPI0025768C3A|nr:hypothetical protein [Ignatzschineria indica]MDM1544561.1 hypothetical protein [Ignatzschineria indica]
MNCQRLPLHASINPVPASIATLTILSPASLMPICGHTVVIRTKLFSPVLPQTFL